MKVLIVAHENRPAALALAVKAAASLRAKGAVAVALGVSAGDIGAEEDAGDALDAVLAVGGDGTVLRAAKIALSRSAPILGINYGRVGYLAEAEPGDLDSVLERLVERRWTLSERMTLGVSLDSGPSDIAINDVVVDKIRNQRLVRLEVLIDGERFLTYRADGLVMATPTGSTAYSFSAGGPIVDRAMSAIVLTPVASHTLFHRSLVLPPDVEIRVVVADDRPVGVAADGRDLGVLAEGQGLTVKAGSDKVQFIDLGDHTFRSLLQTKFDLNDG